MPSTIEQLKAALQACEGSALRRRPALPFGVKMVDSSLAGQGLRLDALHEVAPATGLLGDDAAATLFIAGIVARSWREVLWVVRRRDLFAPGLMQAGLGPERVLYAEAADDAEALALVEEGLRHRGLGAVVGEVKRVPMAATRRLQLAAEGGRTIALLLRRPPAADADPLAAPSAAVTRWRIGCAPSAPLPVPGVGRARWDVELVRQRGGEPGKWMLEACDETGRCALPAAMADRTAAAGGADVRAA